MREAVGLPRPPGPLPLAFLHMDLDEHVPMRIRAEAAERLVLSGAVAAPALFAAYRSGEPAASGGVWDRAQAVQALDAALAGGADGRTGAGRGRRRARRARAPGGAGRGLRRPAGRARPGARSMPTRGGRWPSSCCSPARVRRRPGRRAPRPTPRWRPCSPSPGRGRAGCPGRRPGGRGARRARRDRGRPTGARRSSPRRLAAGRQGEAILAALALIRSGPAADPPALRAALMTLRLAGQEDAARADRGPDAARRADR